MTSAPKSKLFSDLRTFILIECFFLGYLSFSYSVYAQPISARDELAEAIEHAINTLPASQLGIYNGRDYTPTAITAAGHPYFPTDEMEPGTIFYDGIRYNDIYLIFDASLQCVVIEDYAGNKICPVEQKIESFVIGGHTFKRVSDVAGLAPGFYEVLVHGTLFAKRSKSGGGMQWKSSTDYYFLNEGKIFQLTNNKSINQSMGDRENDIRRYMRDNKLSLNKNRERTLVEVVQYYLRLKQQ